MWGLKTELQESSTSNKCTLSLQSHTASSSQPLAAAIVNSLKVPQPHTFPKLVPQLAGNPFRVLVTLCQHILSQMLAFLFPGWISSLQSFHINNPRTEQESRISDKLTCETGNFVRIKSDKVDVEN